MWKLLGFIEQIPKDKKKHILVGLGAFIAVLVPLTFTPMDGAWIYRTAWTVSAAVAGGWELWQKIAGKGTPEMADFLYSITIPTAILIINDIITWAL